MATYRDDAGVPADPVEQDRLFRTRTMNGRSSDLVVGTDIQPVDEVPEPDVDKEEYAREEYAFRLWLWGHAHANALSGQPWMDTLLAGMNFNPSHPVPVEPHGHRSILFE